MLALAALLVRFAPAIHLSVALALPRADAWLRLYGREATVEPLAIDVEGRRLAADLYRPASPRGALLLVHGLSPAGAHHPELVRLARLLARHGRLVLVPHFEGLAAFHLSGREVDEVRAALRALGTRSSSVGVVGFSFGAGPALLAAADVPGLTLTASFGGYADLRDVLVFLTTGVHEFGGHRYRQPPEEYNRWKLLALLVGFVNGEHDRRLLDSIARQKLADPGVDTSTLAAGLEDEGRAILALATNHDERAIPGLLGRLPRQARAAMDQLSPVAIAARLPGRLLIAHGADDRSIPFTESLRLAEASRGRATAVILESFQHTGPARFWESVLGEARDGARLLRLTDALLTTR